MPRDFRHAVEDMLREIDGIFEMTKGKSLQDFENEWALQRIVERGIEIISEASRVIPDDIKAQHAEIPWKNIRGIGNVLRHEYHSISNIVIWRVVEDELQPLKTALLAMNEASS